jgi:hypothetical protein
MAGSLSGVAGKIFLPRGGLCMWIRGGREVQKLRLHTEYKEDFDNDRVSANVTEQGQKIKIMARNKIIILFLMVG